MLHSAKRSDRAVVTPGEAEYARNLHDEPAVPEAIVVGYLPIPPQTIHQSRTSGSTTVSGHREFPTSVA